MPVFCWVIEQTLRAFLSGAVCWPGLASLCSGTWFRAVGTLRLGGAVDWVNQHGATGEHGKWGLGLEQVARCPGRPKHGRLPLVLGAAELGFELLAFRKVVTWSTGRASVC